MEWEWDSPPGLDDLKYLFGDEPPPAAEDLEDDYSEYDDTQLFTEHDVLHRRLGKSLYYGGSDSTSVDSLSLPLTQLCVDHFNKAAPASTSSSPGSNAKAGIQLDMAQASNVARDTCSSPTSLVLALLYLERLRGSNPGYLDTVSSADLFLVSLMVASKYLHDDGEEDEVFNDEWASSGGMTKRQLNDLEMEFLVSLDWRLHVTPVEFEGMAQTLEQTVVKKQITQRNWNGLTYTDLQVLSKPLAWSAHVWDTFLGLALKVTTVVVAAYAASLVSMLATCHLLNQVKLGPNAISRSANTLYSSAVSGPPPATGDRKTVNVTTSDGMDRIHPENPESQQPESLMNMSEPGSELFCVLNDDLPCQHNHQPYPSSANLGGSSHICSRRHHRSRLRRDQERHHLKNNNFLSDWRLKLAGFPLDPDKPRLGAPWLSDTLAATTLVH